VSSSSGAAGRPPGCPAVGPACLVTRTDVRLRPDPSRTLSRLFVPGQETLIHGQSRATLVINRVLAMSESEVERVLARTMARFGGGYRDLAGTFDHHYDLVAGGLGRGLRASTARRQLIGAYFTQQYALEAAALFNPSIVPHPDQGGCPPGAVRFVLSLRAVGEGHLSSIEFRTGQVAADGTITVDEPGRFLDAGRRREVDFDRALFRAKLAELGHDDENADFLWSLLPPRFTAAELDAALAELAGQHLLRGDCAPLVEGTRWMAASSYEVEFDAQCSLSERVLWPSGPADSHGMEDARFVRFMADADGSPAGLGSAEPIYLATYSAYDGRRVASHLLETRDFRTFTVSPLSGQSTRNKGLAIFPRPVGGRYAALSRWDRESNAIAYSDDGHRWTDAVNIQVPARSWDAVQLGNCGSPLETSAGWLVLTHGVGPMREYAMGAILLDLAEPERLIGSLPEPLLIADETERSGYVPDVVYSCGALRHGDTIVLPYGCSDSSVRFATVDLRGLLRRLTHP
jgi:predicted GH43/DUF377 family glycosyl hydrolase